MSTVLRPDGAPTDTQLANWIAELRDFVRAHQAFWCLACYEIVCTDECPLWQYIKRHAEVCRRQ